MGHRVGGIIYDMFVPLTLNTGRRGKCVFPAILPLINVNGFAALFMHARATVGYHNYVPQHLCMGENNADDLDLICLLSWSMKSMSIKISLSPLLSLIKLIAQHN